MPLGVQNSIPSQLSKRKNSREESRDQRLDLRSGHKTEAGTAENMEESTMAGLRKAF